MQLNLNGYLTIFLQGKKYKTYIIAHSDGVPHGLYLLGDTLEVLELLNSKSGTSAPA